MKSLVTSALIVGSLLAGSSFAEAASKNYRAQQMSPELWAQAVKENAAVEFRQGDEVPLSFTSEGDFLETTQPGLMYLRVKRSFWMRLANNIPEVSLDGTQFRPFNEVATGSLAAGVNSSDPSLPVNAINVVFKSYLK
jgi:hypothetical protein